MAIFLLEPTTAPITTTPAAIKADQLEIYKQKLATLVLPEALRERCSNLIARSEALRSAGNINAMSEIEVIYRYLEWVVQIPFGKVTTDNLDLVNAEQELNKEHFGLKAVKEEVLEYLATQKLLTMTAEQRIKDNAISPSNPIPTELNSPVAGFRAKGTVLCFVGVQGVGKTTMARSIANAMGRKFFRIALGAFASAQDLRGSSKFEQNAEPGVILKAIIRSGTFNPVILLDELDKVSEANNTKADIMATLLEILDPEQNFEFNDRYLDFPIDLSKVLFICTANNIGGISAALLDRLEPVRFSSYSDEDKIQIAQTFLFPKVLAETGIQATQLQINPDVWPLIVRPLGFDPGIRQLERNLKQVARKVAKMIVSGQTGQVVLTVQNFHDFIPQDFGTYL